MTDLKPCPFCGGTADIDTQREYCSPRGNFGEECAVYCLKCDADMSMPYRDLPGWMVDEVAGLVVERWNSRAHDPASFEAGEHSMRKRAAALVGAHSDLPATTKINVIKAGFARRLTVSILALPTGETND